MILYVKTILKTHTPKCKVYRCVQLTIRHNWCKSLRFQTEPPSPLDTSAHGSHIPGQKALICWPLKTLKMMSSSIRHFLNIRIHVSFKSIWTNKYLLYESYLVVSLLALSVPSSSTTNMEDHCVEDSTPSKKNQFANSCTNWTNNIPSTWTPMNHNLGLPYSQNLEEEINHEAFWHKQNIHGENMWK